MQRLKYANALWDETARLNTVAPVAEMEVVDDDILPAVPELNLPPRKVKRCVMTFHCSRQLRDYRGDLVSWHNWVMSRMPEIWGEDAATFNPGRWFKENGDSISYSPFSKYGSAR